MDSSSRKPGPRTPKPGGDAYVVQKPSATGSKYSLPPNIRIRPIVEADPLPTAPRLAFWSGLFTFPLYPQSLLAWMTLAFAATFAWLTLLFSAYYLSNIGPYVTGGMILGVGMVEMLTISYTATCYLWIVQHTADGYNRIEDWELGEWREWPMSLIEIGPVFCISASVGGALAWALKVDAQVGVLLTGISFWALYPVLQMSVMEHGAGVPWSPPTLRSLRDVSHGWLVFYLESGLLMAAWLTPVVVLCPVQPLAVALVAGPLLGAAVMIHARLLGRLAWYIEECNQRSLAAKAEEAE